MAEGEFSIIFKNYVTSIAVIIGGSWAIYKWIFTEWLRRRKEIPAIEGRLETQVIFNSEQTAYVTLTAYWNNKSSLPYQVDTADSYIDVYKIPSNTPIGLIEPSGSFGRPFIRYKTHENYSYTLQPMSESAIQSHFHLENDNTYLFEWRLSGVKYFTFTRTLILHIPKKIVQLSS